MDYIHRYKVKFKMEGKSTDFHQKAAIDCNGKALSFDNPRIMGILNITPDSFYDGGSFDTLGPAMEQCGRMINEGADIIDIGGVSTRPGAATVPVEEELNRILPVLREARKAFPETILSIDTYHSEIVRIVHAEGADMINDVSGGNFDPDMIPAVAGTGLPYVIMHMQGTPQTMQQNPVYENVVREVREFLFSRAGEARMAGIRDVIIDPGFGFGKTLEHNFLLLKYLGTLGDKGYPVMAGVSRKSMVNKLLGTMPRSALNGTTAVNTIALLNGADILRVHEVKEAVQAREIATYYRSV